MSERPPENPRATFVHKRGDFLQPTERVEAGLPSLFGPPRKKGPHDRLGFARWLVSPQNPLVGRVTMNRQWQAFFGRGLVQTTEDFGYQGSPPTHPELLDWLAIEFLKQNWSHEGDAPLDRDECHVSPVVAGHAASARQGSGEQAAQPCSAGPARSGARPRCRVEGGRAS